MAGMDWSLGGAPSQLVIAVLPEVVMVIVMVMVMVIVAPGYSIQCHDVDERG